MLLLSYRAYIYTPPSPPLPPVHLPPILSPPQLDPPTFPSLRRTGGHAVLADRKVWMCGGDCEACRKMAMPAGKSCHSLQARRGEAQAAGGRVSSAIMCRASESMISFASDASSHLAQRHPKRSTKVVMVCVSRSGVRADVRGSVAQVPSDGVATLNRIELHGPNGSRPRVQASHGWLVRCAWRCVLCVQCGGGPSSTRFSSHSRIVTLPCKKRNGCPQFWLLPPALRTISADLKL